MENESFKLNKVPESLFSYLPIVFAYADDTYRWEQVMLTEQSAKKVSQSIMEILIQQQDELLLDKPQEGFLVTLNDEVFIEKDILQFYPSNKILS